MELAGRIRWLALAAPVALAAVASPTLPASTGALAAMPAAERPCPAASARARAPSRPAWYRLDAVLDARGTLVGQQLVAGVGEERWSASLPPESFASGPVGALVLVGDDDGERSRLRTLDAAAGCWAEVGTSSDVVRSAVLMPGGQRAYEHRVERATRRDLGVWERDLETGRAGASPLLAGLPPDPAYGPTFATSVLAAADGRLVVSSCGERACRTRVVDPASGQVAAVGGTGPAAGVVGGRLIALEACGGLPCPLDAFDLASGDRERLRDAGGLAVVAPDPPGAIVLAGEDGLEVLRLGARAAAVPGTAGLVPLLAASTAVSGAEAPRGRVALAPDGLVTDPAAIRFLDPAALQPVPSEVLP